MFFRFFSFPYNDDAVLDIYYLSRQIFFFFKHISVDDTQNRQQLMIENIVYIFIRYFFSLNY